MQHLRARWTHKRAKEISAEYLLPSAVGAILFEIVGWLVFKLNLWAVGYEILMHGGDSFWFWLAPWLAAFLSLVLAAWSVGGASLQLLNLIWGWARLHEAGSN
jgi:hypothetical protein